MQGLKGRPSMKSGGPPPTPHLLVIWQVGSLLPLPALGSDVQGLPHPLLSGPPVGLGPGSGQREAASMCRPGQRDGACLAPSSLTATPTSCQQVLSLLPVKSTSGLCDIFSFSF